MIKVYSTGCPRCLVLENKLKASGKTYEVSSNIDEIIEKGFSSAPVLEVDGEFMDFSKAIAWLNS